MNIDNEIILNLAEKAGFDVSSDGKAHAHKHDMHKEITKLIELAANWGAKQESEACASLCDENNFTTIDNDYDLGQSDLAESLAKSIRYRSNHHG